LRRVGNLEARGVIRGYTAIIAAPEEAGVIAIVRISLERQTEAYLNRFEEAVRQHPEIEECFLMTGDEDYVLRASAASTAAYEEIHKNILSR
jgi:DNA-binding Lrp family transcriptional regulator